jgi:AraC-like DNA-binding protein
MVPDSVSPVGGILKDVGAEGSVGGGYRHAGDLLPGFVSSVVGYSSDYLQPTLHRGLPSAHLTFVFSLADPVVTGETPDHARGRNPFRNLVIVGGLHTRPAFVVPDDHQRGVQVSVHPLAARALFGAPVRELTALVNDGPDVLGAEVERVRARMRDAPSWTARFAILQEYLRRRVDCRPPRHERVRTELLEAWRWLAWHRGTGSLDGLADHVHLSPRQLRTLFVREVGVGPKQVSRLMRFTHARQRIAYAVAEDRRPDLAGIAARSGYFDHAHLDRDFAHFAGTSPRGWIAEERRNIQDGGHRNDESLVHE